MNKSDLKRQEITSISARTEKTRVLSTLDRITISCQIVWSLNSSHWIHVAVESYAGVWTAYRSATGFKRGTNPSHLFGFDSGKEVFELVIYGKCQFFKQ